MHDFQNFGLPASILESLERMRITVPTPIQVEAIPAAIGGADLLASAQTGTGKTIAYLLPILSHLSEHKDATALVLAPTRELAAQVREAAVQIAGKIPNFTSALLIGGEPMGKQLQALKRKAQLVIGTPGRVLDHLERGTLKLNATQFLVLDETDRMLDMGFSEALEAIIGKTPQTRQTLMFSATMPQGIVKASQKYLNNPQSIAIGSATEPSKLIKHESIQVSTEDKFEQLLIELKEREGSVIVFVKTKIGAQQLATRLQHEDHNADAIHGDLKQRKREQVILAFRKQKSRIMVATDVAARGLDIPHIKHVINYDLPQCPEDYVHRIGRTGRAGAEGFALSFISPEDGRRWRMIHRFVQTGQSEPSGPRRGSSSGSSSYGSSSGGYGQSRRPGGFSKPSFGAKRFERGSSDRDGERAPRSFDRDSSERAPRSFDRSSSDRPARSFDRDGERAPRSFDRSSSDRPARSFDRDSERGPRSFDRSSSDRSARSFDRDGERAPRSFDRSSSERAPRSFDRSSSDRPARSFNRDAERPTRSFERDVNIGSDRPARSESGAGETAGKPRRSAYPFNSTKGKQFFHKAG
jgi:ATP-dependent RNA helicase DeaD